MNNVQKHVLILKKNGLVIKNKNVLLIVITKLLNM